MLNIKLFKKEKSKLEIEIEELLDEMNKVDKQSEEYDKLLSRYSRLVESSGVILQKKTLSSDVLVNGALILAEILLVLNYEKLGIITSKAFSRIPRGRI